MNVEELEIELLADDKILYSMNLNTSSFVFGPYPPFRKYTLRSSKSSQFCDFKRSQENSLVSYNINCVKMNKLKLSTVDLNGKPIENAKIYVLNYETNEHHQIKTNNDGVSEIPQL